MRFASWRVSAAPKPRVVIAGEPRRMPLVTIGFCGSFLLLPLLLIIATSIVGFIEGIIYLTKSDAEFEQIYVQGTRDWF